jgi:hypothetical protein
MKLLAILLLLLWAGIADAGPRRGAASACASGSCSASASVSQGFAPQSLAIYPSQSLVSQGFYSQGPTSMGYTVVATSSDSAACSPANPATTRRRIGLFRRR